MRNLEQCLQDINADFISFNGKRQAHTRHYDKLRDTIYSNLKSEKPIGSWLTGHRLGGSYGDGTKITRPDEFDLVINLKFPENDRIKVRKDHRLPGNVHLDMTEVLKVLQTQPTQKDTLLALENIVTSSKLLLQDKLQDLITSAFVRVLNKMANQILVDGHPFKIIYKRCGPAHTIFINERNIRYSVDFVPAIKLNANQNILGFKERSYFGGTASWDAVPKPQQPFQANNTSFRASYYEAEQKLIKDMNRLKDVIKLMKKFRDSKQNMNNVKSYFIKTLVLRQAQTRPKSYWSNKRLCDILIDMFGEWAKCFTVTPPKGKLPFLWDSQLDLVGHLSESQRRDIYNCIEAAHYTLRRSSGNLTDDFSRLLITSFSVRNELGESAEPTLTGGNMNRNDINQTRNGETPASSYRDPDVFAVAEAVEKHCVLQ